MTENYRKTVFCEIQFLKECLSEIDMDDKTNILKRRLWNSVENLLLSPYVNLVLDISCDDFVSEIKNIEKKKIKAARKNGNTQLGDFEELLWELNYKQEESSIHIKCNDKNFISIDALNNAEHPNMNAIYLTCKDANICEDISRKYGISILSSKKFDVNHLQFEDTGCAIAKDESNTNWLKILQGKCNICNAMIIVDNYILSDTCTLNENLREILQALLPDTLSDIPFHLSVFTSDMRGKSKIRFEWLKETVKELRPNLECKISLFKNGTDIFHDRIIITNNFWIDCGGGFNLFKKGKSDKMTVVNIVNPYLTDTMQWAKKAYSNLVKSVKKIISNKNEYINESYPAFYLGSGINRLTE